MGKSEIDNKKKEINAYCSSFNRFYAQLGAISLKLSNINDFNRYSTSLKPEIDKILFIITDLIYESNKIKENKTIKKFLYNEFNSMVKSRNNVIQLKKEIESKIPLQNV